MKRLLALLTSLFLFMIIIGCSQENLSESENEQITVFGGSVGGIWSIFTEGISEAYRKEHPGTLISSFPGTVAGNPILVDEKKADFAISESLIATFAYEGDDPFDQSYPDIRAVANIMPTNIFQLVAPKDVPFDSIEDIVEQQLSVRYSAGEVDALGDLVSSSIFEAYGLTYADLESYGGSVSFLSGGKSFELMADARIDGLGKMVPIPAGDIIEASARIDLKFISIGKKAVNYLVEEYGMSPYTMKAGSYDFQTEDYETVNSPTILITNQNMSEETVYRMAQSIYHQLDYLHDVHRSMQEINDETIAEVGNVPLHPGAEKFYEEIGILEKSTNDE